MTGYPWSESYMPALSNWRTQSVPCNNVSRRPNNSFATQYPNTCTMLCSDVMPPHMQGISENTCLEQTQMTMVKVIGMSRL